MENLDELALRIRDEVDLSTGDGSHYSNGWYVEYARRLVAALPGEPVAWMSTAGPNQMKQGYGTTILPNAGGNHLVPLYAAPIAPAQASPGMVLVPREPTEAMISAVVPYMRDCESELRFDSVEVAAGKIYHIMLAAIAEEKKSLNDTNAPRSVTDLTQDANTYRAPRDCKHGRLARSCEICDLERELARVTAERDALNTLIDALEVYMPEPNTPRFAIRGQPAGPEYFESARAAIDAAIAAGGKPK